MCNESAFQIRARIIRVGISNDGNDLGLGFRIDILVENQIILELKSVSALEKVHFKQLQTHLKLSNKPLGYLINFNADKMAIGTGIHRITNINYHE